jgi:signal transduction histidine kinase
MGINCQILVGSQLQQPDFDIVEIAPRSGSRVPLEVTQARTDKEGFLCMTEGELPNENGLARPLELSAAIASQVNEPLAAIALNAEASLRWLIRPKPDVREASDALRAIVREIQRASEAIQKILCATKRDENDEAA